jgi:hypothetical protein
VGYFAAMLAPKGIRTWLFPFTHWNWKVAVTTAFLRGIACMLALRHADIHARQHFGAVEAIYVLFTAGFFSALQQQSLTVKPRKLAWLVAVVVVPLTSLGADSLLHLWLNRINAHMLGIGALIFTLVSAMFHWHIMQNGALLVGQNSTSLMTDLKRLPRLFLSFLATPLSVMGITGTTHMEEENDLTLAAMEP